MTKQPVTFGENTFPTPSSFRKKLRPEQYSDSEIISELILDN
jgi:hypothetical protein